MPRLREVVILTLLVLSLLAGCGQSEVNRPAPVDGAGSASQGTHAVATPPIAQAAAQASNEAGATAQAGDIAQADPACRACRQKFCTHVEGSDFSLIKECFDNKEPLFTQQCIAAKNCMYKNKCGLGPNGSGTCFCGTTPLEECFFKEGTAQGPCLAEFKQAGRRDNFADFIRDYDSLALPMGVAHYLHVCDRDFCKACLNNK